MALTKVIGSGVEGISNASNATFLTATAAEGVTLAGTLAVTGVHTVGTNAVATSEGGAATSIINQGLTKVWIVVGLDDTTIDDSFNVASVTDTATGRLTVTITNDMASANYSGGAMAQAQSSNNNCTHYFSNEAAGTVVLEIVENGSKFDAASTQAHILGDLA